MQEEQPLKFKLSSDMEKNDVEQEPLSPRRMNNDKVLEHTGFNRYYHGVLAKQSTWDPFYQYRSFFPFPWLSLLLFLLLFLSLLK